MSVLDSIGKGFRFFLMSMGVSTYGKKAPVKATTAAPKSPPPSKPGE